MLLGLGLLKTARERGTAMSEHKDTHVVIVDIKGGDGKTLQVPMPAELWAKVTRTAEENGTPWTWS